MANEEQLEILKSGVEEWNKWRKSNLLPIDLRSVALSSADLCGADLRRVDLRNANFRGTNLRGANLSYVDLRYADLRDADLAKVNLVSADLRRADLLGANLFGANLDCAKVGYADLRDVDLHGANLSKASFRSTDLSRATLSDADLRNADLSGADLSNSELRGANLKQAVFHWTNIGAKLNAVQGLDETIHYGPSAIGAEALEVAQGSLPDVFLRGIGFKDWEILSAKLHDPNLRPDEVTDIGYNIINLRTKGPIQVNTLFLSYARLDNGFVEFLEKRLDDDGIRSWRDVHDMVAGPVQPQIERAIGLNGTVLLVLSKNSLGSDWVEWEVQKARDLQKRLEGEGRRDAHVLCPVAIDDAWKDSKWSGPLMNQLFKYNILDFSKWEDEEAVEKVYAKLKAGIAKYYSDSGSSDESNCR